MDAILIRGGRVYDHDGDTDQPPLADLLVKGDRIAAVAAPGTLVSEGAKVVEAKDRLVMPGFVSAHYHSHDVLHRGAFDGQ